MTDTPHRSFTLVGAARRVGGMALPLSFALLIDSITQFVIVALLGHMGGEALYVRSIYLPFAFLILAVQEGFGITTQVVFARLRGRQRPELGAETLLRIVAIGLLTLLTLAIVAGVLAPVLGRVLHVPSPQLGTFIAFTWFMVAASIITIPTTVPVAALRGWGRPGWSLILSGVFASVQMLGVWLVGMLFGGGVMVLPIFVLMAGLVGGFLAPVILRRGGIELRSRDVATALKRFPSGDGSADFDDRRESRYLIRSLLLGVGIPVALSYLLLMFANLAILLILTPFGANVQAAFGAVSTTQTVVILPAVGFASATSVIMNQHIGAAQQKTLPIIFWAATMLMVAVYAAAAILLYLLTPLLTQVLVGDNAVRLELGHYLGIVAPSLAGLGVVLFFLTLLEQLGAGKCAVVLNLVYYVFSLGLGGVLADASGRAETLYSVLASTNVLGMIVVFPITYFVVRRRARAHDSGSAVGAGNRLTLSAEPDAGVAR